MIFFSIIACLTFNNLNTLKKEDFLSKETFLIYIYYLKPGTECFLCKTFNDKISEIPLETKKINFYDNPYIASHMLQFTFPSFVVRHNNRSYVLQVNEVKELFDSIIYKKYLDIKPVYWLLEPTTILTKIISLYMCVFFYLVDYFYLYIESTPAFVINGVVGFIVVYLCISIIDLFKQEKVKVD